MTERLLGSNSIVGSDLGKVQIVARGIDQYDRHRALVQQTVVVVRGIGFGEVAPGKDHPCGVLVEQHGYVLGLGQTIGTAGAQHGREVQLGQSTTDHLS